MKLHVNGLRGQNRKVGRGVVLLVAVNVVNHFAFQQWTPELLLCNTSVLMPSEILAIGSSLSASALQFTPMKAGFQDASGLVHRIGGVIVHGDTTGVPLVKVLAAAKVVLVHFNRQLAKLRSAQVALR